MNKSAKIGIVFSYILIILNSAFSLFVTPFLIYSLGDLEYGVYKTMTSLTTSLMVLDLGLGTTAMRFVASFKAKGEDGKISNYFAMMLIIASSLSVLGCAALFALFFFLPAIYTSFNEEQLNLAKSLYGFLSATVIMHIVDNVFNGVISGYNRFDFSNGMKVLRLVTRIALIFSVFIFFKSSLTLVILDLAITTLFFVIQLLFVVFRLRIRPKLEKWDKGIFKEVGVYAVLMFLTSIAAQVNNTLDNVVIGAIKGPSFVTVYSIGLLLFGMFENLATSVSGVMLPSVANIIERDDWQEKAQEMIVKVGRVQFLLLGAAVAGFCLLGNDFICLWVGERFEDVYIISIILMVPALLELCVNTCLAVLRAKNKLGFRTTTLMITTFCNFVLTVVLVKYWSYIGAAIGTAFSFIVGSVIVMNIYYYKTFHFNMFKIYGAIFKNIWLCILVSSGVVFVISRFFNGTWLSFFTNVLIFLVIYAVTLLLFGLNKNEKESLKLFKKKKNEEKQNG